MKRASLGVLFLSMLLLSSWSMVVGRQMCQSFGFDSPDNTSAVCIDIGCTDVGIKWNTAIPPECIISLTLIRSSQQFGTDEIPINAAQTEATLSGLHCDTQYNFWVSYRVQRRNHSTSFNSTPVSVYAGVPPTAVNVTAAASANNTGIVVSWRWNRGLLRCLYKVHVVYQPERGSERELNLNKSATSTTLQKLQYNTQYTIYIRTTGSTGTKARTKAVTFLLGRGRASVQT